MDPTKYAQSPSEHAQQVALFMWASQNREQYPELEWMFAIPNGGERNIAVAARLRAEGVRSGVADVFLPAGRFFTNEQGHPDVRAGLFIEMKKPALAGKKSTGQSETQIEFEKHITKQGYSYVVCYTFQEARDAVIAYLEL